MVFLVGWLFGELIDILNKRILDVRSTEKETIGLSSTLLLQQCSEVLMQIFDVFYLK